MRGLDGLLMVKFHCRKHARLFQVYFGIPALADADDISAFSDGTRVARFNGAQIGSHHLDRLLIQQANELS
jgi:hypothetical protein